MKPETQTAVHGVDPKGGGGLTEVHCHGLRRESYAPVPLRSIPSPEDAERRSLVIPLGDKLFAVGLFREGDE